MEIKRVGSQQTSEGPVDWFTGSVRIEPVFEAPEPARVRGPSVMSGLAGFPREDGPIKEASSLTKRIN